MEARTVNNLPPAASHDDDAVRCVLAIELSKKSWIVAVNTPLVEQDQSPHVEARRWEGAVGSVRADQDASCQRNEEARGNRFLLRSGLRWLLAPPPARSTRHSQLRDRPGKSAG